MTSAALIVLGVLAEVWFTRRSPIGRLPMNVQARVLRTVWRNPGWRVSVTEVDA